MRVIGVLIKSYRTEFDLSVCQVAKFIGISESTLRRLENEFKDPLNVSDKTIDKVISWSRENI
jgi:DNA-binding XRE family transcriptional regulator